MKRLSFIVLLLLTTKMSFADESCPKYHLSHSKQEVSCGSMVSKKASRFREVDGEIFGNKQEALSASEEICKSELKVRQLVISGTAMVSKEGDEFKAGCLVEVMN